MGFCCPASCNETIGASLQSIEAVTSPALIILLVAVDFEIVWSLGSAVAREVLG